MQIMLLVRVPFKGAIAEFDGGRCEGLAWGEVSDG